MATRVYFRVAGTLHPFSVLRWHMNIAQVTQLTRDAPDSSKNL
ncbi:MAG: hypothetical protein ACLRP3_19805 [Escherichia sp.]